jgi:two-component system phosphate regulon sensor histidine kinase PhoR
MQRPGVATVEPRPRGELEDLLAIASHELKTPATVIKAEAQFLMRRVLSGAVAGGDVREGLAVIADQADRLSKLVNHLLDLSRLETGHLELECTPTNLGQLVAGVAAALQVTTDQHSFTVEAAPSIIGMWDLPRIEEVVENLLGNAIKYSPNGGTIAVRVAAEEGDLATVSVRDQGVGIGPEDLPHLFERFYRVRAQQRLDGAGLGLSICQAMVTAHGGSIWAESEGLGRGSAFGFSLPRN